MQAWESIRTTSQDERWRILVIATLDSAGRRVKPNLLLIGAPRCASTALAAALGQHAEVAVCDPKETHFLATHRANRQLHGIGADAFHEARSLSPDDWLARFPDREARYRLDASVSTMSYPTPSIRNIETYCSDDVRLLVVLREPVERAFSSYQYLVSRGWTDESFEHCLAREPERLAQNWQHLWLPTYLSRYRARLAPFLEHFPHDRVHVVVAEEFAAEPQRVLEQIFRYLELRSRQIDDIGHRNQGGRPRSRGIAAMAALVYRYPFLRRTLRAATPTSVRELLRGKLLRREQMSPATRSRLRKEFADDIDWVQAFLGRSLPGW